MKGHPRLFRQFIVRALVREKARTAIAVLGIALGVAVMIAVRMANTSVTDSFRAAVDSVGGEASLRISGRTGRFDETLLRGLVWLEQFGTVSPVVESYVMVAKNAKSGEADSRQGRSARGPLLHLIGVDALVDLPIRRYRLLRTSRESRDPTARELLRLLTDPQAVVLTEKFARRERKDVGDRITLVFGSRRKELTIRGLLVDEGPARALGGNFALMDLAAAQWACDRLGLLDYVDVKLKGGLDPDQAAEQIRRRLPEGLVVGTPDERYDRQETMIRAFHFDLAALSGIALLVGLFLIYNTISISVAARREEIGMLQAVGSGRWTVLWLFLGEALMIAAMGTVLGLWLGGWLARAAVVATADTVETFYIAEVARTSARKLSLSFGQIGLAVAVAVPLSLIAAAVPALEAAATRPVEVIRGAGRLARSFRPPLRPLGVAAALFGLGWGLTRLGPVGGRPVFGFLAEFVLMLAGAILVPGALWLGCKLTRRVAARLLPVVKSECRLAASNLLGAIPQVSISVAALAVSLAMMVAIAVMVGSFRQTVVYWLNRTFTADLFVRPTMLTSSVMEAGMDHDAVAAIQSDPDVRASVWFSSRQVPFRDTTVRLAVTDLVNTFEHARFLFKAPADPLAQIRQAAGTDCVLVSESFSLRFEKQPGDLVRLPTASGIHPFRVAAVYYDYASNQGTAVMDAATYARHYAPSGRPPKPGSLTLYLRPGADAEAVRSRLIHGVGDQQDLYIVSNENVRREAMRIFESTFTITYALEVIAIVIAGLGVVSTLITLIYERQREIALLSLVGARRRQIRRMVVIEAVLLGGTSQLVGVLIGIVLAVVLIDVINVQSFGWTIQFRLPLSFLAHSTLCILLATAVCGLYPASRAAGIDALKVVRDE